MRCRAIEGGQWVLLDSANLCNPTVLDRLNPLLEPQGQTAQTSRAGSCSLRRAWGAGERAGQGC